MSSIIPIPKADVSVRDATLADVAFIDSLQKMHGDAVGFMRTSWIEERIRKGHVIVAEEILTTDYTDNTDKKLNSSVPSVKSVVRCVGYCMGVDRYLMRDDVGIIYQMNVVPGRQRGFVGATLLKAMFERSAYGCRLYCCWCAQDLAANYFWEAMGFVPLAFRTGSEKRKGGRVHILWQKKITAPPLDTETKWWYPFQTRAGAIRADRLVFPIPEGTHWRDVRAVELPDVARSVRPCLPGPKKNTGETPVPRQKTAGPVPMGGFRFQSEIVPVKAAKVKKEKPAAAKIDPKYLAAGREFRDRYLEYVNANPAALLPEGKYDVSRALPEPVAPAPLLLPAA